MQILGFKWESVTLCCFSRLVSFIIDSQSSALLGFLDYLEISNLLTTPHFFHYVMLDSMDETAAPHPRTDKEIKTVCFPALSARLNMTENNCAMISVKCLIRDVKITQTDSDNHSWLPGAHYKWCDNCHCSISSMDHHAWLILNLYALSM